MEGVKIKTKVETSIDAEKDDDRAAHEHEIVKDSFNVDVSRPIFPFLRRNPASFLNLNLYVKSMIFKMLDLGSQCNLSIVWEDMKDEFWKSVDVERRIVGINSIEELVYAGVLATGGVIDTVEELNLNYVNVSSIPVNIINNVMKIVKGIIFLEGISGWRTSMLDDVKCQSLSIRNMDLESQSDGRPFMAYDLSLIEVRGDLTGLFGNFDVGQMKSSLKLNGIDFSNVPDDYVNRLFKTFSNVSLGVLDGFKSSMMNGIDWRILELHSGFQCTWDAKNNSKQMMISELSLYRIGDIRGILDNLKSCDTWNIGQVESSLMTELHMNKMLNDKVRMLQTWYYNDLFPKWLNKYNGQGKCSEIILKANCKNKLNDYKAWAKARGWKCEATSPSGNRNTYGREYLLRR